MREYTMTDITYRKLKARERELNCEKCGKEIKVGDRVISRIVQRGGKSKRYHKKCWEEGFI